MRINFTKILAKLLFCTSIVIVVISALFITGTRFQQKAEAVTIVSNDTGIAQGALVDRPPDYQDKVLDATAASGAKWIRLDLWWFQVEKNKGTYNWDKFDALYKKAHLPKSEGGFDLNVLIVVTGAPTWATGCTSVNCPPTVANVQKWKDFLTAAATRYSSSTYGITTYEIWNEPNITTFYEVPNASTYVNQVLKPAYEAITAALPGATVLTGGTAPATFDDPVNIAPWEFVRDIYAAGGKNYFHHIAHHPYTFPNEPLHGNAGWNSWQQMDEDEFGTTSIRTTMNNNQDGAKKIWITEVGYPAYPPGGSCKDCISEDEQKLRVAQVYNEWSKKPWGGKIFWFSILDEHPDYLKDRAPYEANFGLKRVDNTAKPALDPFSKIVSSKYTAEVLADSPGHFWRLNELAGTRMINLKNSSAHGIYKGTYSLGQDGTVVGATSVTFPGANASGDKHAEVAYDSWSTALGTAAWTVEFTIKRHSGTNWPGIIGRGSGNTAEGWFIFDNSNNSNKVTFRRNSVECPTTSTAIANGKSHHYALTKSGSTLTWYVDGVQSGTCTVSFPSFSLTDLTLTIGRSWDQSGNNSIGNVAMYSTALSATRIKAHSDAAVRLP